MNAVDAICKFARELGILHSDLGVNFLIVVFHPHENLIVVIVITIVRDVSIALLPGFPSPRGLCFLVAERRESNRATGLQGAQVGEIELG